MSVQTSYSNNPAIGYAGMLSDNGPHDVLSGMSASRKLISVAVAAANGAVYTVTLNGTAFVYTADGSATTAEITAGLVALIEAGTVAVKATGTDTPLLLESELDGTAGDFTYSDSASAGSLTETVLVAQSQSIPFGVGVCFNERALLDVGACDFSIRLPRLSTDITTGLHLGVALADEAREGFAAGAFRANTMVPVLREGRVYVVVEEAVVKGGDVYVRYAAGGNGLGSFGAAAGSSERALWPRATYMNNASIGGLAIVEINR